MSRLFINEAEATDLDVLLAIEKRGSPHPWTPRHFLAAMDPVFRTRILVVRHVAPGSRVARVVAFCALRLAADEVHIENLAVDIEHRRRGLAGRLLAVALAGAARQGARTALLEVREGNTEARRLYARLGFGLLGVRREYYREPTEDAVVLARTL